ncbi:MAG: lipid-A-disaccharide synthase [Pseudomonadota bacterium]
MRIGIIVGEASGDLLGAALIEQLQKLYPHLTFDGVLGPRLKALGGTALYESERLAVMGFIEPLKRLPELLRMRHHLIKHYRDNPPDVFIGIDAPDFNLGIECKLKKQGIKTVHYVSPSVWAWRQGRIKKIKQAVDLMLVLFPFEAAFYEKHCVPVVYVGHPMAMQNPPHPPLCKRGSIARQAGGFCEKILAILPGSRHSEIAHMTELFLKTALLLKAQFPQLQFISPMASPEIRAHFLKIKALVAPDLEIKLFDGQADEVLAACDCALITSGTATFQAMLHHCPMVVAYKTSKFNAWLIRKLYKHRFFALPNILFGRRIIPEYFQEDATPASLFQDLEILLKNQQVAKNIAEEFLAMHQYLREPAIDAGAKAIKNLIFPANSQK